MTSPHSVSRTIALLALLSVGLATAAHGQKVVVGTVSGNPGTQVSFDVTLDTPGTPFDYAAISTFVAFDNEFTPVANDGSGFPDCIENSSLSKDAKFIFWPEGCVPEESCTQVRAILYYTHQTGSASTIPDDSVLFSCNVDINSSAPAGDYPLLVVSADGSTASSQGIDTAGDDGMVAVNGAGCQ
jgi:hypothetical protein